MEATILWEGEYFLCQYFYDIYSEKDGVDVHSLDTDKYIGTIKGLKITDESFEETVKAWLKKQDVNYKF